MGETMEELLFLGWYYRQGPTLAGPVPTADVRGRLADRRLEGTDLVWGKWRRGSDVLFSPLTARAACAEPQTPPPADAGGDGGLGAAKPTPQATSPWFVVEPVGAVTVVRFGRVGILEGEAVTEFRERVFDLVDRDGRRLFLLNFGKVAGLASGLLGQLVALHQKLRAKGGRLVLCEVSPFLYEFFEAADLPGVLCIRGGERQALASAP
jgi:stage II sporulation protein AA (anti-sigma F factor antagonist)